VTPLDIVAEIEAALVALRRYDTDSARTRLERLQLDIEIEQRRTFRDTHGRPIAPPQSDPPARPVGPWSGNADAREPVK